MKKRRLSQLLAYSLTLSTCAGMFQRIGWEVWILPWSLQKGVVVIQDSSNPDHIRENTELFDFALTDEELVQIKVLDRNEKHDWY